MLSPRSISILAILLLIGCASLTGGEGEFGGRQPDPRQPDPPPRVTSTPIDYDQVTCPSAERLRGWFQPISQVRASLIDQDEQVRPLDCSRNLFSQDADSATSVLGPLPPSHFMWAPSHLWHQPLYFDDTTLERYGQTICPPAQPLLSALQFYATFPIIPYKLGLDHPYDSISSVGYFRPGSPTPPMRKHIPFQFDAATLESAAWAGAIFLLP